MKQTGLFALFSISLIMCLKAITSVYVYANNNAIPEWGFGASRSSQAVHIDDSRATENGNAPSNTNTTWHFVPSVSNSTYSEGDFIGTLHVERLDRTVRIYEGESMRNMDYGAGRFLFSGLHSGNMGLIGHNRGPAGFFSFVRLLQYGDVITIETSQGMRRYSVEMMYTINESDFTSLQCFNDNRLTLITCVEYQPTRRRVAVAMRI